MFLDETPLERALRMKDEIEFCDQCPSSIVIKEIMYCKVSGKIILPMFLERGHGYGMAHGCKDKPKT
jgi:hypothetical protein